MHRCLLVSEILYYILEFVQQYDKLAEDGGKRERMLCKRTLASLARTCHAFSVPALNILWMRLDSLDPLIRLLPSCIWAKEHSRLVIRMLMTDKHWLTFRQYAVRVQFLHGPGRDIPPSVQRNVISILARFQASPLLPNLTELVWGKSDPYNILDPIASVIKYFAGSKVITISLFLSPLPRNQSVRAVLANLPNLCPNVTSFTIRARPSLYEDSRDIGDILSKWSNLQVLRSCTLSQAVIDVLASRKALNTLTIELDDFLVAGYITRLPVTVHTFSLEGINGSCCMRYLQRLQGTPTHFGLYVGLDITLPADMHALFQMLPTRFDTNRLQSLTIGSMTSSYSLRSTLHSFPLMEQLVTTLFPFSALIALDLNTFSTSGLDDAAYGRLATAWPALRSLKLGAQDESRATPTATVGAVIAVLRSCPYLETLHIVFDGRILPPPSAAMLNVDQSTQHGILEGGGEDGQEERMEEDNKRAASRWICSWGISNQRMTHIHVGHSPVTRGGEVLKGLVSCLRSVMPRLRRVQSGRVLSEACDTYDMAESEGWRVVQRLLENP